MSYVRKVPKAADTVADQAVAQLLHHLFGQAEDGRIRLVLPAEALQRALRQDLHPVDLLPDQPRVLVKDADQAEALGLKGEVLDQRHSQVARAQQDDLQPAVSPRMLPISSYSASTLYP